MPPPFPSNIEKANLAWQKKPEHRLEWLARIVAQKRWDIFVEVGTDKWPLELTPENEDLREEALQKLNQDYIFKKLTQQENALALIKAWEKLAPDGYQHALTKTGHYLIYNIFNVKSEELLHHFIQKGFINPNESPSRSGGTLMHLAASMDWPEIIEILHVQYGLDPNGLNLKAKTPLHLGAWKSSGDVVFALKKMGANIHAQDDYGKTALVVASLGSDGGYSEFIPPNLSYIEALLKEGADIHIRIGKTERSRLLLELVKPEIKEFLEINFEKQRLNSILEKTEHVKSASRNLRI